MALALFILDNIGIGGALEAVDVLHFCSEDCRQVIAQNTAHKIRAGESIDYAEGTVCDECGEPLTNR